MRIRQSNQVTQLLFEKSQKTEVFPDRFWKTDQKRLKTPGEVSQR
jgi:hypothetical protein